MSVILDRLYELADNQECCHEYLAQRGERLQLALQLEVKQHEVRVIRRVYCELKQSLEGSLEAYQKERDRLVYWLAEYEKNKVLREHRQEKRGSFLKH
jgi:AAA+ ATPase superfamily predicted ATPase